MLKLDRSPLQVLLGLLVVSIVLAAPAAAQVSPTLAASQLGGTVISWQPQVDHDQIVVRVQGPAGTYSHTFSAQEVPFFDLSTVEGPADGSYTFELRFVPRIDPEVRAMLQTARSQGNGEAMEKTLRAQGAIPSEPLVQTGSFRVVGGQIVSPDAQEPSAGGLVARQPSSGGGVQSTGGNSLRNTSAADQVILDDLIVDGSACVGQDCVNGESFGFDTLRLKENNTRIKFDDTSNSGSFPNHDWELVANDSTNGGTNKFSIQDDTAGTVAFTIKSDARNNALYLTGKRAGLGTTTPALDGIHIVEGNTPALRLEQDGSSGFQAQTWDLAGNEAGFFVRDVTNGSQLPFRIIPGAKSSSLVITADNDILIAGNNATSADAALHVKRTSGTTAAILVEDATSGAGTGDVLLTLKNNGPPRFDQTDDNLGVTFRQTVTSAGGQDVYRIQDRADADTEFELNGDGDLTILGSIFTGGTTCNGGCDLVFKDPATHVESIKDHAAEMWENSYLPAVGPTPENQPINLSQKTGGILNELEKAHIYIEQLNDRLNQKDKEMAAMQERLARLEEGQTAEK